VRSATNAGRFLTVGVTPEYLQLRNLPVETGRNGSDADVRQERRVAVLGATTQGSSRGHSYAKTETRTNCSQCGKETTVPFRPTQGRPVLCRECFQQGRQVASA